MVICVCVCCEFVGEWSRELITDGCGFAGLSVKLSFIVIPLHVGTYSGTRCRASQDHGAT